MQARLVTIDGIVQGVGFRPFIARLARELGLCGWVRNDPQGVTIHVQNEQLELLDEFEQRVLDELPPAARILKLESEQAQPIGSETFEIVASEHDGARQTLVSPDLATCPDCLRELTDPDDRRYHYPFINCTNCGPRFTIIEDLPYDRPVTSMREFEMCDACAAEYADETDRRYHAQPDACFECGPHLWWSEGHDGGEQHDTAGTREQSDALIAHAAKRLRAGNVLAIKGLGGWHLACDATNPDAVEKLRERKHRPSKPLAVMMCDLTMAQAYAQVDSLEADLLEGSVRPIVLCIRRDAGTSDSLGKALLDIAGNVAVDLPELGIMLPSTPVQHLLLHAVGRPLVMTSGNRSGEPIVADDEDALDALGHIADGFLGNDRRIVARYDDSVVRVLEEQEIQMVRRARGYAPAPLFVAGANGAGETSSPCHSERRPKAGVEESPASAGSPVIFAAGPEQKSTFTFLQGERAYISQHLGDLERLGAWNAWEEARTRYEQLFDLHAGALACDMHPEYLASKWARQEAANSGLQLVEVQHHHAHIASVLGENALDEHVIGVAIDGTGYGTDGTIWGCEVLLADRSDFERFWHLPMFRLPGGAAAIKNPQRTAYAMLKAFSELGEEERREAGLQGLTLDNPQWEPFIDSLENRTLLDQMLDKGINSPFCSSLGRLFDGVAALLGLCTTAGYDGEPACLLEAAARRELASSGAAAGNGYEPLTAYRFHEQVAKAIIGACERARQASGIERVALSGGCMVNRLLAYKLRMGLAEAGFAVYENRELPPNDGCIAYGQAIVARAQLDA